MGDIDVGDSEMGDAMDVAAVYNPFEPGFAEDPYDQYARIRAAGRTQHTPFGQLLVHRYDDCFDLLRQPGTSVSDANATVSLRQQFPAELLEGREQRGRNSLINLDPPDHTRIRRLVASAFTVRRVEQLRGRVRQLIQGYLDEVEQAGAAGDPVDLMALFAFPLPFQVITDLLGMPEGDRAQLRRWSHTMTRVLEPFTPEDELRAVVEAGDHMTDHLSDAIEWKRRNPGDDLLSAMIAAEADGDTLSTPELRDQVMLLYLAGHETTVNLIGNGTVALLRHRDQLERLTADPGLDAMAVDELLRWDSPVQISRRIAMTEMTVGDQTVAPGDLILTLLGAANRDPAHWGDTADRVDLGRPGAGAHLSFGSGIHHCLGAALARLEGAEALGALARRFPRMELATDGPRWNGRIVLRGVDTLEIATAA